MTVTEKSSRKVISGSGWANPLTHDYMVENASYVHVFADTVELVQGVDYTVSNVGVAGGYSVTVAVPASWAPAVWVLDARPPIAQGKSLTVGGVFGEKYEDGLDQLARRLQRVYDLAARSLKFKLTTPVGSEPYAVEDVIDASAAALASVAITQLARDLAQQYAANAAIVSGVNVPIYASVASAAGSTIAAGVKNIRTQYHTPSYATPATLVGGAEYARISLADFTAGGYDTLSRFRSTDRFMPDGTTDNTNGGYWVVSSTITTPHMFGGKGDGATNDTAAILAAAKHGKPCFIPAKTWLVDLINLSAITRPVEIYGENGTILQANTVNVGVFYCLGRDNIHLHHMKLVGKTTVYPSALHGAITLAECDDCHIHDIACENWMDRLIYLAGTPSTNTISKNIIVERVAGRSGQLPARFSGSGIYITSHTENYTIRDCSFEDANGGIFIQNSQLTDHYHFRNHKILNNRISRMAQYGIICYGAAWTPNITGVADNGAGAIRITLASHHELTTSDQVLVASVTGTTEANGLWLVDVIDADNFDLRGSVFTNAWISGGTFARYNPSDIEIAGNVVEDIDGTPTVENGLNGSFGAGIYCVGMSAVDIHDNSCRRVSMGTTTSSLAPAGIGVSGIAGALSISNNIIEDCEWRGVYVVSSPNGTVLVDGNEVRRCGRHGIYTFDVGKVIVSNNTVNGRKATSASTGILIDATTATQKVVVTGNNIHAFAATQLLTVSKANDLTVVGNNIVNDGLASVVCELAKFITCSKGTVSGNNFDGGLSANAAVTISACTDMNFGGNAARMTSAGNPTVSMSGVCAGTVWDRTNTIPGANTRMENLSTGGIMHTRDNVNTSGGKTRQIGDTIENTAPVALGSAEWVKLAASAGGLNWQSLYLAV